MDVMHLCTSVRLRSLKKVVMLFLMTMMTSSIKSSPSTGSGEILHNLNIYRDVHKQVTEHHNLNKVGPSDEVSGVHSLNFPLKIGTSLKLELRLQEILGNGCCRLSQGNMHVINVFASKAMATQRLTRT